MKVKNKVSSFFLCLHNSINKNFMLLNVITFNILRNNDDDDVNFGETLSMVSKIDAS